MPDLPRIKKISAVASSKLFKIEEVDLVFSNGEKRCYERIAGNRNRGSVLIVPIATNNLLLVREYMVGVERYEIAFPKGLIEAGEDILTAANRELSEETGYRANNLSLLKYLSTSPGYQTGQMPIVLAQNLYPAISQGDEPEPIEVIEWALNNIPSLIEHDEFTEARSIAALYLSLLHLQKLN